MVIWYRLLRNSRFVQTGQPGMPQPRTQGPAECEPEIDMCVVGWGKARPLQQRFSSDSLSSISVTLLAQGEPFQVGRWDHTVPSMVLLCHLQGTYQLSNWRKTGSLATGKGRESKAKARDLLLTKWCRVLPSLLGTFLDSYMAISSMGDGKYGINWLACCRGKKKTSFGGAVSSFHSKWLTVSWFVWIAQVPCFTHTPVPR